MGLHVAYFQPVVIAADQIPPVEFSKIHNIAKQLHDHPELNDHSNPFLNIRGGQQIQVHPNTLDLDVSWLTTWLETVCQGYMELVTQQSGKDDLKYCKPIVTSIWTIKQMPGQYQELHTHPAGHISGNMYLSIPELAEGSNTSDGQVVFRMPHTRDVSKFILSDSWKYTPEAGSIVVFPSHLPHAVYPWHGTDERMVMSFDATLVPKE